MTHTKPAMTYGMCFRVDRDGEYGHINGWLIALDDTKPDGFAHVSQDDCPMHDLAISSQASKGDRPLYAWNVYCDAYKTDLANAQRIVKVLTPIHRKLDRMYDDEGNAQTFGIWVNRVCRSIGAKRVFIVRGKDERAQTGSKFRSMSIGDAVYSLDRAADELVASLNPQPIAA